MSAKGFPSYDRQHVPVYADPCHECERLRQELDNTQKKNSRLRNQIRFLEGLPPRNTNQVIERLRKELGMLSGDKDRNRAQIGDLHRKIEKLESVLARTQRERNELRAIVEATKPMTGVEV